MEKEFKHIIRDEAGRPWIKGTNLKVLELVLACQAYGWSAREYHLQHPSVSLAQVYAALAFYYAHQAEMDQAIREVLDWAEAEREKNLVETAGLRDKVRRLRQRSA